MGAGALAALMLAAPALADEFPGAPPDCWSDARIFHAGDEGPYWEKNTRITRVDGEMPKGGEASSNKGYAFFRKGEWPRATILVNAEKGYLLNLEFSNLQSLGTVSWVNEKLLFVRLWWGRATGTDLIVDVESETIVYNEQFHDGYQARQQFLERCPTVGCTCIPKK